MIALLIAGATAFLVVVTLTPVLIRILRARAIGQHIRDDGPIEHPHLHKAGTPTMGGIALVVATFLGYCAAHLRSEEIKFARSGLALLVLLVGMAVVGFVDDYLGVRRQRNLGLRKRGKSIGQLIVAALFAYLSLDWVHTPTELRLTGRPIGADISDAAWFVLALLVIYSTSTAVNLTDGMDGLAVGSATFCFVAFTIIAFWQFRNSGIYGIEPASAVDLAVLAAALAGSCGGFLWWNAAPAQIFLGDTGALAIGGGLAGLALLLSTVLLLPIMGGIFVVETLSVLAQIVSYRGFKRRILRMAPIHHHFEVGGWPEFTVIVRFWLFAGVCAAMAIGIFYADFINVPGVIG